MYIDCEFCFEFTNVRKLQIEFHAKKDKYPIAGDEFYNARLQLKSLN